jgi:hypothetical protein
MYFNENGFLPPHDYELTLNDLRESLLVRGPGDGRKPYRGYTKKQLPMWHRYRVELYPHFGQPSGIKDEYGHDQQFPAAFRKSRDTFLPKGIIKLSR